MSYRSLFFNALLLTTSITSFARDSFLEERSPIQREEPIPVLPLDDANAVENSTPPSKGRWLIDRIIARVDGANILHSDLGLPRIAKEGDVYSLEDMIIEEVFFRRAQEFKIVPTMIDIERQIAALKNGISEEEFKKEVESAGLTINLYREQLIRLMAVENVKRTELGEKLVITNQEIENYCSKNPEYHDDAYWIKICSLPKEKVGQFKELLKDNKIHWLDLSWVDKADISKEFSFVHKMKVGQVSKPFKSKKNPQYKALKLVDKRARRLKSVDERYTAVERLLFYEKRERSFSSLKERLKSEAVISIL